MEEVAKKEEVDALSEAEEIIVAVALRYGITVEDAKLGVMSNWTESWCRATPLHGKVSDYCDARTQLSKLAIEANLTLSQLLESVKGL